MSAQSILDEQLKLMIEDNLKQFPNDISNQYKPLEKLKQLHSYRFVLKAVERSAEESSQNLLEALMIILTNIPKEKIQDLLGEETYNEFENLIANV